MFNISKKLSEHKHQKSCLDSEVSGLRNQLGLSDPASWIAQLLDWLLQKNALV